MLTEDNWYPINILRNAARLFVPKQALMTLSDAQFMFSFNFETIVKEYVASDLIDMTHDLLVYRIFEGIPDGLGGYPLTMEELKGAFDISTVRVFHELTAIESHWIPDLEYWLRTRRAKRTKKYRYLDAAWEPQFVAQNNVPFHDEAFPYLIRDNANQRWTLCRAGYRFHVMNMAFAIHPGFKNPGDAGSTRDDRQVVLARYAKAVTEFNAYMDKKYPDTRNKCPHMEPDDRSRKALQEENMVEKYSSAEREALVKAAEQRQLKENRTLEALIPGNETMN
ncbi:unnamed protein product, partial [Mesorhabditis spiculigera]